MSEDIFAGLTDIDTSLMAILTTIPDKRERIATAAMQAIISNNDADVGIVECANVLGITPAEYKTNCRENYTKYVALKSAEFADALIAELEKTKGETT